MNYYLCPAKYLTLYFMKDIISGAKLALLNSKVDITWAPQYDTISIDLAFEFCKNIHPEVMKYFPDYPEIERLPREFVFNVMGSVVKEPF